MLDRLSFRERLEGIRTARRTLLMLAVVNFAFLTLPLGAFFSVNALPAEIQKETALVSYEHKGSFDYLVYLKPSHLTGPADWEPAENPPLPHRRRRKPGVHLQLQAGGEGRPERPHRGGAHEPGRLEPHNQPG